MTLREKLDSMGNIHLLDVWDALGKVPREPGAMWDASQHITMDDWAEAVYSEMNKRKLKFS